MNGAVLGRDVARVDGRAKVTGAARYAADQPVDGVLYGYLVLGTISRGELTGIDTAEARRAPGVVAIYTHADMPRFPALGFPYFKGFVPMQDTEIHHNGQPVAIVLADTWERARDAADLVRLDHRAVQPVLDVADAAEDAFVPEPLFPEEPNEIARGDAEAALAAAQVTVEAAYTGPTHHHNPIEPHASTAVWDGDRLTLYESTQGVNLTRGVVSAAFGLAPENIRVISPYLGGGFGAKTCWPHTLITVAAARLAGRPVRTVLTRAQMFTVNGHRAQTHQRIRLGANRDGALTAIAHTTTAQVSHHNDMIFNQSVSSHTLYTCPNVLIRQQAVRLDLPTPCFMRSPEMGPHFALETALDELSYELGVDPVDLRLRNVATVDQHTGKPFTGKHLDECYRLGAEAFGWARRDRRPGRTRDGDEYVGWGMATEMHTYGNFPASAEITVDVDGRVGLRVATQDIGTGTYTVLSQVAADAVGVPLDAVTATIGDTALPPAGLSAASATVPSVVGSVDRAARSARDAVVGLAVADRRSPLFGVPAERVVAGRGELVDREQPSRRDSHRAVVARAGRPVRATGEVANTGGHSDGAVFVEVRVHRRYGRVRVTRVVGAYDPGRVMNRRTARGQVIGGVTWGIGYALLEHTLIDRSTGRVVNPNLSTYLVPVNADAPPRIEALFVDRPDPGSAALGAKGFGETPITGVPAAIGNAIFHATGRRLRDVPFTSDKLLL